MIEAISIAEDIERRFRENKINSYKPYPKQLDFHAAGDSFRERLLMAANQVGKTFSGAAEAAYHATGLYPDWWEGKRFDHGVLGWVAGVSSSAVRDSVQRLLLGEAGQWGTGAIPKHCIIGEPRMARGVPGAVDSVMVKHASGDTSQIIFKSYEQGREKWQAASVHFVWFDEEPPMDIYTEGLTRTNATDGIVWMTFTPLLGMSEVVRRFMAEESPDRHVTGMTIDDALHISETKRRQIIDSYPAHEREARVKGIPMLGSGRVFPVAEECIAEDAISIPREWPRIVGLDIGYDHPTACAWIAWDRDTDTVHVYDTYRVKEQTPAIHGAAIRSKGATIPVAWPHDGLQHDKGGSCEQIAQQYRNVGVNMLHERATFPDGGNGVEAGIMDMLERMQTGRLKVAKHLNDWWDEYRQYHRKDGLIVKERDDLMAATRYAIMMLRYASTERAGSGKSYRELYK